MTEPYTPTTEQIRENYIDSDTMLSEHADRQYAEFDRWLAAHDADVAATALEALSRESMGAFMGEVLRNHAAEIRGAGASRPVVAEGDNETALTNEQIARFWEFDLSAQWVRERLAERIHEAGYVVVPAALAVPVVGDDHQECMTLEEHASLCGQIEILTEQLERVGDDTTETDRDTLAAFMHHDPYWNNATREFVPCECGDPISPSTWQGVYEHWAAKVLERFRLSSRATRPEGQNQ